MNWQGFAKLGARDMCIAVGAMFGGLIVLGVVVVIFIAGAFAIARAIVGG